MKTLQNYFSDWESSFLGFGYGSGEQYTTPLIKRFLSVTPEDGTYNYKNLENALTPPIAWLLINLFIKANLIDYGTSPRYGWLTDQGKELKKFVELYNEEALISMLDTDEDYIECYRDVCNCIQEECKNPFWVYRKGRQDWRK